MRTQGRFEVKSVNFFIAVDDFGIERGKVVFGMEKIFGVKSLADEMKKERGESKKRKENGDETKFGGDGKNDEAVDGD